MAQTAIGIHMMNIYLVLRHPSLHPSVTHRGHAFTCLPPLNKERGSNELLSKSEHTHTHSGDQAGLMFVFVVQRRKREGGMGRIVMGLSSVSVYACVYACVWCS